MMPIEVSDGVALLRLDKPAEAEGAPFADRLTRSVETIERDPRITAAVIVPGERAGLVAGVGARDILRARTASRAEGMARAGRAAIERLASADKPFVAAVIGPCLGAAFEVALACRARVIASDPEAVVGFPEVTLGLLPAQGGLERLAAIAGLEKAIVVSLSGKPISPRDARRLGLADASAPKAHVMAVARAIAQEFASGGGTNERGFVATRRRLVETNPIGRAVILSRSRQTLLPRARWHEPAPERILAVLEAWASRGASGAREIALRAFGELAVSAVARRCIEVYLDEVEHARDAGGAPTERADSWARIAAASAEDRSGFYQARLLFAYVREAAHLLAEGVPAGTIDAALVAWGFPVGPAALLHELGPAAVERGFSRMREALGERWTPPPADKPSQIEEGRRLAVEEIQMRVALAVIDEAIRAVDEGAVASARDADLGAISRLGFPRFRGGPLRYVDAIGASEVLRRARWYASHLGARFEPSAGLVGRANAGTRIHG
jgi:enoyl-CoA hydratase/carnithine racemase